MTHRHLALLASAALCLLAPSALAFTAPSAGDFGYDLYDIVVLKILGGPIGFIGAVALIVWGATKIMTQWMITIACIIAGTILIKAEGIVTTLGALI
jgi:hypothetical protein